MKRKRKGKSRNKRSLPFVSLLAAGLLFLALAVRSPEVKSWLGQFSPQQGQTAEGTLEVHFIDVGQADSILLLCDGQAALIDGGNRADGELVTSYLESQGVEELDYLFCTHAHEDHVGGLSTVLQSIPAQEIYCGSTSYESATFEDFLSQAEENGTPVAYPAPGSRYDLGDCTLTLLGPGKAYSSNVNNQSLVLRAEHGSVSLLFTGDMERDAEEDLLAAGWDLKADLLKVGHHGSATSTGYEFLWNVMPRYAVISVGAGNDYGHPEEQTLSRLEDAGAEIWRTDEKGTILAVSDGEELHLQALG